MGNFIARKIQSILEVPKEIIINFLGKGLVVDRTKEALSFDVNNGDNLIINEKNQLELDVAVDKGKSIDLVVCDGVIMKIDGRKITLNKSFSKYVVKKNKCGLVVDISLDKTFSEIDEQIVLDYGSSVEALANSDSAKSNGPKFYKKPK
jgi:RNase P/RNase MRP subunit p29